MKVEPSARTGLVKSPIISVHVAPVKPEPKSVFMKTVFSMSRLLKIRDVPCVDAMDVFPKVYLPLFKSSEYVPGRSVAALSFVRISVFRV